MRLKGGVDYEKRHEEGLQKEYEKGRQEEHEEEHEEELKVISLGAGWQSTALTLLAVDGYFGPAPSIAIFADTGWEPRAVYEHLDRLEEYLGDRLLIRRVSAGNIREDALADGHKFASMPLYVRDRHGKKQQLKRQCTREYKVAPIRKEIRKLLGVSGTPRAGSVELWMGISTDEAHRMKPSPVKFITHRYPLIEAGISRQDCQRINREHGFTDVPKSACIGCPCMDNSRWFEMKRDRPEEWADAVDFDRQIRNLRDRHGTAYLHRRAIPLEEVRTEEELGQMTFNFDAECEGLCGV